jgi:opacity protein-like surface antigen
VRKKVMILFLGAVFLLSLKAISQPTDLKVRVIAANAVVKLKPHPSGEIISQVPLGAILQSKGKTGELYSVSLPPDAGGFVISGYIHQDSVEIVEGVPKEEPVREERPLYIPPQEFEIYPPEKVEMGPKTGLGIRAGYAMLSEENFGSGLMYGGNLCLGITKNISIELSGQRFQSNTEGDAESLSEGKLSVIPIQLSLQARFPVSGQFVLYIGGGGGYYLNTFTLDEDLIEKWDVLGFVIEEKVENAIGFHFGAGIDLFFTENIALNVDFRYCLAKTKGSWTLTDQFSPAEISGDLEELSLNSIMLGAGLKFYF